MKSEIAYLDHRHVRKLLASVAILAMLLMLPMLLGRVFEMTKVLRGMIERS
jgi:hypothetical protein